MITKIIIIITEVITITVTTIIFPFFALSLPFRKPAASAHPRPPVALDASAIRVRPIPIKRHVNDGVHRQLLQLGVLPADVLRQCFDLVLGHGLVAPSERATKRRYKATRTTHRSAHNREGTSECTHPPHPTSHSGKQ